MSLSLDDAKKLHQMALDYAESLTDDEDAALTAAALADADNPLLADDAVLVPAVDVMPEWSVRRRGQRGRGKHPAKVQVTVRLDPDVIDYLRASSPKWQARMNEILRHQMEIEAAKKSA